MIIKGAHIIVASLRIVLFCLSQNALVTAQIIPPDAPAALEYYFNTDCTVGEKRQALQDLLKYKDVWENTLIDLMIHGPSDFTKKAIAQKVQGDWIERERHLSTNPALGLSAKEMQILKAVVREEYVDREIAQILREYRERAVFALAAFHSRKASTALDALKKSDPSFGPVITAARKREQAKKKGNNL